MQGKHNFSPELLQVAKRNFYACLPECRQNLIRDFRVFNGELIPQGYILPKTDNPELQDPFACSFEKAFPDLVNLSGHVKEELENYSRILIIDDVCNTGNTVVNEVFKLPQGIHVIAVCPLRIIPQNPEEIANEAVEQDKKDQFIADKLKSINPNIDYKAIIKKSRI
jgi:hypothetical protein